MILNLFKNITLENIFKKDVYLFLYTEYILGMYSISWLFMEHAKNQAQLLHERMLERQRRFEQIDADSHNLDAVINFKVNSVVKSEFDAICKNAHSSVSRELKLYMLSVIKQGKI